MGNTAMLGLLEGLGNGISGMGKAITANSLAEAQEMRRLNRERVNREWTQKENDRMYQRNMGDQYSDMVDAETGAQIRNKDLEGYEGKTVSAAQWGLDHKAPSAFMEKVNYYDGLLKEGKITPQEHKTALGLNKQANGSGGFTPKQRLDMVNKLRTSYDEAMEMTPEGDKMPFESWAAKNRPEAWSALGGAVQPRNNPHVVEGNPVQPGQLDAMFKALLKKNPSTWDREIALLKERGFPEQADILRSRLQQERNKLNESESQARLEDKERQLGRQDRSYFVAPNGGLLEGTPTF